MPDESFSFCYFEDGKDIRTFDSEGKRKIEELKHQQEFNPRDDNAAIIHYSTIPWVSFTSIKHPKRFGINDSVPKIVFGKKFEQQGNTYMPVAVEAHHALLDGYHMGLYFDKLNKLYKEL